MKTGFTFIEILMVIIIVGIFVAMASPRFHTTYTDLQLSSQARSLAKFLTYAQERAVVERKVYRFEMDFNQRRYWLTVESEEGEAEGEGEKGAQGVRIKGRYGRATQLPVDLVMEASQQEIAFYPDGSSDPFTLTLKNREGKGLVLKNGRSFGTIRIETETAVPEGVFAF